jgi:subfamily B ATP-binding cassette protein MsbA
VGLLWYTRLQIKAGAMTTGEFTSFVIALLMLYEPVKRLTGIHNIFQQAIGAAQKVFEYLDREEDIVEKAKAPRLERFAKAIRFENVTFRYPTAEGYQSTLANLVPRFYDVAGGCIRIDGKDIRDFTIASLRSKIGLVAQDTFLFNDTVARNIAYGRTDVPLKAIKEAARNALAHEFIEALPNGYETSIGERGVRLSGGQRQRLSIARAMLKNAPILILDEATSHLDTESELLVQRALANLMVDRTVIVIAHRISTIRRADKIVVIDRGQIVETGSHDELVNGKGIYQRLHELQFMTAGVSE